MIAIGSDHAGFEYKQLIKEYLIDKGYEVKDCGCDSKQEVDYPVYGEKTARLVASGECEKGILVCGTGVGISLAANRVKGIRCVVCSDTFTARASRMHNDTNMLALGERVIGIKLAYDIIDSWLNAEFEGERHIKRVNMLDEIE